MARHSLRRANETKRRTKAPVVFAAFALMLSVVVVKVAFAPAALAASLCSSGTTPIYQTINPATKSGLLSTSSAEADNSAVRYGYTDRRGIPFSGFTSTNASKWLAGVHRMYKARTGEFMYTPAATEAVSAKAYGYVDMGVNFYATMQQIDACEVSVHRLYNSKFDSFRNAVAGSTDLSDFIAAGWVDGGTSFWVPAVTAQLGTSGSSSSASTAIPTSTASSTSTPVSTTARTSAPTTITAPQPAPSSSNPLRQLGYVWKSPYNLAWGAYSTVTSPSQKYNDWQIANNATAIWFGYMPGIQAQINSIETDAVAREQAPIFVLYAIPDTDCGTFSTGAPSDAAYRQWVDGIRTGLAGRPAVLIIEPDAIGMCPGWNADQRNARTADLLYATKTLAQGDPAAWVYVHAGSQSDPAAWSARQLESVGIQYARGFATNISSFHHVSTEATWGSQINSYLAQDGISGKHFVIDTSRSGATNTGGGCDLQNALIGPRPTIQTGNSQVDAYLWVQQPGHSDHCGSVPGDPGGWWQAYADLLVQNSLKAGTISAIPGP